MKRMTLCLLAAALTAPARADDRDAEAKAKALQEKAAKVVELLKGIKDRDGAEKVKAELGRALVALKTAREDLTALPPEERKRLKEAHGAKFEEIQSEFVKESRRLQETPGVMAVLSSLPAFKQAREEKVQTTRKLLEGLDKLVQQYKLTLGDYPKSLDLLAVSPGSDVPPFVRPELLKDPWGRPFQYDVKGTKNKGGKPDIWSLGPPDQKGALIGNWDAKK